MFLAVPSLGRCLCSFGAASDLQPVYVRVRRCGLVSGIWTAAVEIEPDGVGSDHSFFGICVPRAQVTGNQHQAPS